MITDDQQLVKAVNEYGQEIKTYDDGFGPLWVFQQSWGISGLVRAQSWESAYEIVEDYILAPISAEDVIEAYGYYVVPEFPLQKDKGKWFAHEDQNIVPLAQFDNEADARTFCSQQINTLEVELVEGYSYQSNATDTGIVQHDLNGEQLERVTAEWLDSHQITLTIEE